MTCVNSLDICTDPANCAYIKQAVNMLNSAVMSRKKGGSVKWMCGMFEHWTNVLLKHIGINHGKTFIEIGLTSRTAGLIYHYFALTENIEIEVQLQYLYMTTTLTTNDE